MEKARQDLDYLAWDRSDADREQSTKKLLQASTSESLKSLVQNLHGGKQARLIPRADAGSYNILYRFRVEDVAGIFMVRLPYPGVVPYPEEKTYAEAATAKFIAQHTGVPVSSVLHYGVDAEVGAYITMARLGSQKDMADALGVPDLPDTETPVLNPNIPLAKLLDLYKKMATHLLQLSYPRLPRIGSLIETPTGDFTIATRPLTHNMVSMLKLANIPAETLPPRDRTFATADEWYTALAEMHMAQLVFQHNDLVKSEDDCRNKYVARVLFHRLARQGRLSTFGFAEDTWSAQSRSLKSNLAAPSNSGDFRLWCDDLRPVNILVDEKDDILAFIDWEFTYAAPTHFALDPPWWLLLDVPEMWEPCLDNWVETYASRLETWLAAMDQAEAETVRSGGTLPFSPSLSAYMRESWETGRFWLSYSARKSWCFDTVYWRFLDEKFFGGRESTGLGSGIDLVEHDAWKGRVHMLNETEREAMEAFAVRKMEESKERVLVDWETDRVRQRMREVFDIHL